MPIRTVDRTGETTKNNFGSRMEIIECKKASDMTVKITSYDNDGNSQDYIAKHQFYHNFKNGNIKSPYERRIFDTAHIGVGMFKPAKHRKLYNIYISLFERIFYKSRRKENDEPFIISDDWLSFQEFASWFISNSYNNPDDMSVYRLKPHIKEFSPDNCILIPKKLAKILNSHYSKTILKAVKYHDRYINKIYLNGKIVYYRSFETYEEALHNFYQARYKSVFNQIYEYKDLLPEDVYHRLIINITA